ncbi:MAG: HupE/UreJ family protein [Gemmatimonadales bacterium]
MDGRAARRLGALTAALLALGAAPLAAHEIPARVTVRAFIKPEGQTLRVLVRAPLEAMRDIIFPLRWPGYLDLSRTGPQLIDAARLWIAGPLEITENGHRLAEPRIGAVRVSLPSDRSFDGWESALAHTTGPPLPVETDLVWQQALMDVLLEYPIGSDRSDFAIRPGPAFGRLGQETTIVLRFLPPGRGERAFQLSGSDQDELVLDPRWHQAALRFVALGFRHILDGLDHLLFVFALVIPFRRFRTLVAIVTGFTVAHSVTLIASTLGLAPDALWFPPLIETLIAISILYMAFENIIGASQARRWALAFGFGLVHGFGFSFFLRDSLQFAGTHLAASLVSFNVGVELGQIFVLVLAIPVLNWLFRRIPERAGVIVLSALVAHTAWHWMTERLATLRQFRIAWPAMDLAFLAGAMRVMMLLLIVAGAAWLMLALARRLLRQPSQEAAGPIILERSEPTPPASSS